MAFQTVLVTGAAGYVGMAVVQGLLAHGHQVIATTEPGRDSQMQRLQEAHPDNKKLHIHPLNVMDADAVEAFLQEDIAQNIEAAVLLVGGFGMGDLAQTPAEDIDKMINLNFKSAYHLSQGLFPQFEQKGAGRFVFMGARPALDAQAGQQMMAYSLSKGLLMQFAEQLNAAGADKNIVCNVMVPSVVNTAANREAMPDANFDDWVQPAEIAESIAFALSNEALRQPLFKLYAKA